MHANTWLSRRHLPFFYILLAVSLVHVPSLLSTAIGVPLETAKWKPRVAKIALLHMYDSVSFFSRLGHLTGENKERYAYRHGYDIIFSTPKRTTGIFKEVNCPSTSEDAIRGPDESGQCWTEDSLFDIDHTRAPTFGKIKLAIASCRGRDDGWLLWSDADAMVVNQSVPLETIIDDAYDLMFSYDWLMLNAGMLLIKCSKWSLSFLQEVYDARKFDEARALDQTALQEFIDNLTAVHRDEHVKVLPKYAMDAYTEEYRPGDFLMHFAGKLYESTEPGLFAIANQFDILSMTDDVEDIEAFFRGRFFLNYYSGTCAVKRGERQHSCKPDDPRRIVLKEPLGSMSTPNRYRHVGLRYYWLGNWMDKYDVVGWQKFKKPLAIASKEERESNAKGAPAAHARQDDDVDAHSGQQHQAEQQELMMKNDDGPSQRKGDDVNIDENEAAEKKGADGHHGDPRNDDDDDIGNVKHETNDDDNAAHNKHRLDGPEMDHDFEEPHRRPSKVVSGRHDIPSDIKEDIPFDDDDETTGRSPYFWIFLVCGVITGGGLIISLTRRKKLTSKTH